MTRPIDRPLRTAGKKAEPSRTAQHTDKPSRRLSAFPPPGARFALLPGTEALLRRGLAEVPAAISVEALGAAHDAWLEGSVASTVRDGVATIPIRGALMKDWNWLSYWYGSSTYEGIAYDLALAVEDPEVRAIVLAVDSPGGQVDGCHELAQRVLAARDVKPLVTFVDGQNASSAYWMSTAAHDVVVAPTAMAGCLGAVMTITDWSKYEATLGVETIEIVSTQSPKKRPDPKTDSGRAQLQVHVDALAEVMLADVAAHRGVSLDTVRAQFGQGDVFVGQSAIDAGLADAISTYDRVVADLSEATAPRVLISLAGLQGSRVPGGITAAYRAATLAALTPAGTNSVPAFTPEEALMAIKNAARPAATAAADPADDPEKKPDDATDTAAEGEDGEEDEEETTDETVEAVKAKFPAAVAALHAEGATAERARIASIRALGRAGVESLIQACIDDPKCTASDAALRLVQHDQQQRAGHLRAIAADAQQFTPPSATSAAAGDPESTSAVAGRIIALHRAHSPRRPTAAGRS